MTSSASSPNRTRVLRSQTRNHHTAERFNQLLELSCALTSIEDKEAREKIETAEILSLLGVSSFSERTQHRAQVPFSSLAPLQHHGTSSTRKQQQPSLRLAPISSSVKIPLARVSNSAENHSSSSGRSSSHPAMPPQEGEKKRKRSKTTPEQLSVLMEEFKREPMPNAATRQTLATRLEMTPRSVQVWFQNMRAKVKKTNAAAAAAAGDEKDNTQAVSERESLDDGPSKKRPRTSSSPSKEGGSKLSSAEEKPHDAARSSISGPVLPLVGMNQNPLNNNSNNSNSPSTSPTTQLPPIIFSVGPQGLFSQAMPEGFTPFSGHGILGMPLQLQFIPQSMHCDQIQRALPSLSAHLSSQQQQQMLV